MSTKPTMNVYYNSACPVCKAGIENQKNKKSTCAIQWYDIHPQNTHQQNEVAINFNVDIEFIRKRLHVMDEQGNVHVGFNALLALWRNSPTETWKANVLGLPAIRQMCSLAYNLFAALLYRWNRVKKHW